MAQTFPSITPDLQDFIARQHMFFVATAPLSAQGHINLSPKGTDCFRVLSPQRVAYLDLIGSGNETAAHLLENGRITFMFCAFEGEPQVMRLYGTGRAVQPNDPEWQTLAQHFTVHAITRQIIVADITRVMTACGGGVPFYDYKAERTFLFDVTADSTPEEIQQYVREYNATSIDGLPTK